MRRIRLGHISPTAAARDYLTAIDSGHTETDVNGLANDWGGQADHQRTVLLGENLPQYRQRATELLRGGLSTAAAQTQAFTELAPPPAAHQEILADQAQPDAAAREPARPPAAVPSTPAEAAPGVPRFRPEGQADLAPSGTMARIRANLAALQTLRAIQADGRPATASEQTVLARWSGWGAIPAALDPLDEKYTWVRDQLVDLLDERGMAAARATVINAHYTDAALVEAIWDGVSQLGFTGGRVLEPGCGAGNFLAYAPDDAQLTGIELDPTTAAIAAALHPHAQIQAESFADTRAATGSFDLTIGNVPFGDVRLHDKRDNAANHKIHNHFILKSLRLTRPGGLVAVITSAYTMDAENPAARREMAAMADLVGAVRLPSRAHAKAAGTDALTDVLVFRRHEDGQDPAPFDWEYAIPTDINGVTVSVNGHFLEYPHRVLGRLSVGDGLYRHDEVSVTADPATAPAALRRALTEIAEDARPAGLMMTERTGEVEPARRAALIPRSHTQPEGYLRANETGTFSRLDDGAFEDYAPPKAQAAELRALLRLRDTAVALLEAEASTLDDTTDIDQLRAQLNTRYDSYTAKFGYINRFTEKPRRRKDPETGQMVAARDEETGEPLMRRERPRQGGFRRDPFAPVVRALEKFDEETHTATKADIFGERVVSPRPPRLGADNPAEALAICIDDRGEARLDTIAWLLGIDEDEARRRLGTLVYDEPATGRLEPAAAYLSGDVKTKLAIARAAADEDSTYAVNVAALENVVPRDLGADEIVIKMGAPWIGTNYIQQFLADILDDQTIRVEYGGGAMWSVESRNNHTIAATSTWGTDRRNAAEIAEHILEQREFVIKDTVGRNPRREVVNLDAIMAATEKAMEMRERFADWVWESPQRAAELVAKYNDTFQRNVPRTYDDAQLSLPGLAMAFKPDKHQVAAVARMINEPAVGLYHAVGAGKTASLIMGAMELRRLGLVRKPVVVVPNQLLDQWTREFLRLYPQAKLLAADTENLSGDRRRLMVARMATGDWDAVVLTESAFEMLPMSPDAENGYVAQQTAELEERISDARASGQELTLKRLETMKANRKERLTERLDNDKDAGIWWELTGVDYIIRDESHRDKNLRTVSKVSGMSIKGSQRAQQMDMKLAWLREHHPRWATRATGTPIANSIVELFTEFRYLRPDLMQQQGITDIDSWLATYAEGKVAIEVTPDGGGLRNKTRLEFVNLDELITILHVFADVKTKDDLGLERPPLAMRPDGQRLPEMVVVQPSEELLGKVAELVERAAKLRGKRPEKGGDNILKIVGEGAAAALDIRLAGLSTDEPQKLDIAADRIAGHYRDNADRVYTGNDGQPQPIPGALQMVFCDLGTPSAKEPNRWTSYGELRTKLAARGVPRDKVRFIHDATDDRERAELFAACRDGRIAVLIGSTEKMGTGVNVQDRLVALHHLDCPYRPCDLEQRDGRIDRRGNGNDEIRIERYVTERSLDAFKWQKVAYKAKLGDQVLTGKAGRRTEDVGEVTLSYEEMKAAATGNPLLVDHAKAKTELARLEQLERGFHRSQSQLRWTITNNRQEIGIGQAQITEAAAAIAQRIDTHGDAFTMTIRGQRYTKRAEANERLRGVLGMALADPRTPIGTTAEFGEFAGFPITATTQTTWIGGKRDTELALRLQDAPGTEMALSSTDLQTSDLVTRLENRLGKLGALRTSTVEDIARREQQITAAEQELTKPFRRAAELSEARANFRELDLQVVALAAASEAEANAAQAGEGEQAAEPGEAAVAEHRDARQPGTAAGAGEARRGGPPGSAAAGPPSAGRVTAAPTVAGPNIPTAASPPGPGPEPAPGDVTGQSRSDATPPLPETQRLRRGHAFYPPASAAAGIPKLYETEGQPAGDKIVHLHYFAGGFDWWLTEYDPETGDGFGYACLGDPANAEWGHVDLVELEEINAARGLVVIERDLHWTPVRAADAKLPGWRVPTAEPTTEERATAAEDAVPVTSHAAGRNEPAPAAGAVNEHDEPELTATQQYVVHELSRKDTRFSTPAARMSAYQQISQEDLDTLPALLREALNIDLASIEDTGLPRERSEARRLMERWSAADRGHSQTQREAIAAVRATSMEADAGRVAHYGRMSAAEYHALHAVHRDAIAADLQAIAASGATTTIPRNRTSMGTTIRGVTAPHVEAARTLLRAINAEPKPLTNNEGAIGTKVWAGNLNPGDRVIYRGREATVDRVGLDGIAYVAGGTALPGINTRFSLTGVTAVPPSAAAAAGVVAAVAATNTDASATGRGEHPLPSNPAVPAEPDTGASPAATATAVGPAPVNADATATVAEPVRIEASGNSVLVYGTSKTDSAVRAALKGAGFKWSGNLQAWYLPRNLRPQTRTHKIGQFRAAMRGAGRTIPILGPGEIQSQAQTTHVDDTGRVEQPTEQAAGPTAVQLARQDAVTGRLAPIQLHATAEPRRAAHPAPTTPRGFTR